LKGKRIQVSDRDSHTDGEGKEGHTAEKGISKEGGSVFTGYSKLSCSKSKNYPVTKGKGGDRHLQKGVRQFSFRQEIKERADVNIGKKGKDRM